MKKIIILFWISLFLGACSTGTKKSMEPSLEQPIVESVNRSLLGIWPLQGTNSVRGAYEGQIEIRERPDGKFDVIRIVTYKKFEFEQLSVQEVWTGLGDFENDKLSVEFRLRQADFLKSFQKNSRTQDHFSFPVTLNLEFRWEQNQWSTQYGIYSATSIEFFHGSPKLSTDKPIWIDERQVRLAEIQKMPEAGRYLWNMMGTPMTDWYRKQPEIQVYAHREEFKKGAQYFISDPTDFDFYQTNKQHLRVVNKVIDPISLVEAALRREAYAYSFKDKMLYYEEDFQKNHINSLGLFSSFKNELLAEKLNIGTALGTSLYLATEAMRYESTYDRESLVQVKKMLEGLFLLMDVTGDPYKWAHQIQKKDNKNKKIKDWNPGQGAFADYVWQSEGNLEKNNENINGLIFAFLWAYRVLPEAEEPLRGQLLTHMSKVYDLVDAEGVSKVLSLGVKALVSKDEALYSKFLQLYFQPSEPQDFSDLKAGFYFGGVADWQGLFIKTMASMSGIQLSESLPKIFPKNPNNQKFLKSAHKDLLDLWKTYAETKRDFLSVAALAYLKNGPFSKQGPSFDSVNLILRSLREIPRDRNQYDVKYDQSLRSDWALSAWPKMPWGSVQEKHPPENYMQGAYAYPLFEGPAVNTDFIWMQSPFVFQGKSFKSHRISGLDYLFTYWMARWSNLISDDM